MDKKNLLADKSRAFALRIITVYKFLCDEKKEFVMSKQLLRCGTSIGANIAESLYAQSTADFVSKLSIALKEASETKYWLDLLEDAKYLEKEQLKDLKSECVGINKMLSSSIRTAKENHP